MARLDIRSLTKSFGVTHVIKGVDLSVEDRDFSVFLGPSGCGKSTLLRLIAGLDDPTSGEILLDNKPITDLPSAKRNLAMVFQSYALYPHMTVRGNMSFALEMAKADPKVIEEKVNRAAKILNLVDRLDFKPSDLSGGQRQRVAIGRALVREPRIFLFDEPLSNLDAELRAEMRLQLARLHKDLKATMIYVTHDQVEAMTLANKVTLFNNGNVEQHGPPQELYKKPRNRFVAGFLGSPKMVFLEAQKKGGTLVLADGTAIPAPPDLPSVGEGQRLTLGVRSENFTLNETGQGTMDGAIELVEILGSDAYVHVEVPKVGRLAVRREGDYSAAAEGAVGVRIKQHRYHVFDGNGLAIWHPEPTAS